MDRTILNNDFSANPFAALDFGTKRTLTKAFNFSFESGASASSATRLCTFSVQFIIKVIRTDPNWAKRP